MKNNNNNNNNNNDNDKLGTNLRLGCITMVSRETPEGTQYIAIKCKKGRGIILPGGKHEKGETLTDTALRELKEETGLVGHSIDFLWGYPDGFGYFVYTFRVLVDDFSTLGSGDEEVGWYSFDELLKSTYTNYYTGLADQLRFMSYLCKQEISHEKS